MASDIFFTRENELIIHAKKILDNDEYTGNELYSEYEKLTKAYKQLNRQNKKLIKISDQLQRSEKSATTELEHLSDLSKHVSNSLNFDHILSKTFKILKDEYLIEGGVLLIKNTKDQSLKIEKCNMPKIFNSLEKNIDFHQKTVNSILDFTQYNYLLHNSLFCDNITADEFFQKSFNNKNKQENIKSFQILTIFINHKPFGIFLLINFKQKIILDRKQQSSILKFTNHITMAIKNSILYEKSEASRIKQIEDHLGNMEKLNKAYYRFVPKELLNILRKEDIQNIKLGDQIQKNMTVLFADIRSFTTLSEKMTPKENFNFINAYLGYVGPLIRKNNGYVDKYIGDGIMAIFPNNPDDAVKAAIEIQQQVTAFNKDLKMKDFPSFQVGIGIHYGKLTLGIIGEEERMEGTVISDTVNLSSRLESLTKNYHSRIIISNELFGMLESINDYDFRFLGIKNVKGKLLSVSIFEILNGDPKIELETKIKTKDAFEKGVIQFESQNFKESRNNFLNVLSQNPNDKTASTFLRQIDNIFIHNKIPDTQNEDFDHYEEIEELEILSE